MSRPAGRPPGASAVTCDAWEGPVAGATGPSSYRRCYNGAMGKPTNRRHGGAAHAGGGIGAARDHGRNAGIRFGRGTMPFKATGHKGGISRQGSKRG